MNKIITISIFIAILFLIGYFSLHKKGFAVYDETEQLRDSVRNQNKIILRSAYINERLQDTVALKTKEINASEIYWKKVEIRHQLTIASLQHAHQSRIDSLFKVFYPDSSKRDIVITHVRAEECDSVRTILKDEVVLHKRKEFLQESELAQYKTVQIPAYKKIDSAHQVIEVNLTYQLKAAKARRFFVGPSLSISLDGKVIPGISVGYALIKF